MSAAQHTPGPWKVYPTGTRVPGYQVCDRIVADHCHGRCFYGTTDADARLIAAAPDLAIALKACADRMAIAAARGETLAIDQLELVSALQALEKAGVL